MQTGTHIHESQFCCVEVKKKNLTGYTIIEGFPGMGLVGTIAAKYLVDRMDFKEMGHVESEFITPVVRIHAGMPIYPSRIYANDKLKLVVLISEQIIPKMLTARLAKAVVEWIEEKKIAKVISLEGIRTHGMGSEKSIYGIAADDKSIKELKKHKVQIVEDGITTGVTAMILLELKKRGKVPGFSILGNVNVMADYQASAEVLAKLNEILGLSLDVKPLRKEAKSTEVALLNQIRKLKEAQKEVDKVEESTGTPMYS